MGDIGLNDIPLKEPILWYCENCPKYGEVVQIQRKNTLDDENFDGPSCGSCKSTIDNIIVDDNCQIMNLLTYGGQRTQNRQHVDDSTLLHNIKQFGQGEIKYQGTHPSSSNLAKEKQHAICGKNKHTLKSNDPDICLLSKKLDLPLSTKILVNGNFPQPCWKGIFKIIDEGIPLPLYEGILGYMSYVVDPRAVNLYKGFPKLLEFKELATSNVWPQIFMLEPPNEDDVGFYFFGESGWPRDKFIRLVKRLDERNHALKAEFKGARLLIFSSKKLPVDSQRMKNEPYLWGIIRFHRPKAKAISENTRSKCINHGSTIMNKYDLSKIRLEKKDVDDNKRVNVQDDVSKSELTMKPHLNERENSLANVHKVISRTKKRVVKADDSFDQEIPPAFSKKQKYNGVKEEYDYDEVGVIPSIRSGILPPGFLEPLNSPLLNNSVEISFGSIDKVSSSLKSASSNTSSNNAMTELTDPDVPPGYTKIMHPKFSNPHDICTKISIPLRVKPEKIEKPADNENTNVKINADLSVDAEINKPKRVATLARMESPESALVCGQIYGDNAYGCRFGVSDDRKNLVEEVKVLRSTNQVTKVQMNKQQ